MFILLLLVLAIHWLLLGRPLSVAQTKAAFAAARAAVKADKSKPVIWD